MKRVIPVLVVSATLVACSVGGGSSTSSSTSATEAQVRLASGRQLTPAGTQVALGNFPTGAAITADGRFLWTVSAGF